MVPSPSVWGAGLSLCDSAVFKIKKNKKIEKKCCTAIKSCYTVLVADELLIRGH